jgi:hypothetical protein
VEQVAVEVIQQSTITIGEALEASAQSAENKAVDQNDASAIQAAEMRASGTNVITPGGLAATAQSAATYNARIDRDEDKIKLRDVLTVNLYISCLYFCLTYIYIYIYGLLNLWEDVANMAGSNDEVGGGQVSDSAGCWRSGERRAKEQSDSGDSSGRSGGVGGDSC